jgi:hypothetical protein
MEAHMKKDSSKDYGIEVASHPAGAKGVQPLPYLPDPGDRELAIAAGDYRAAVMREVRRLLAESHGNQFLAAKAGLERLSDAGLITVQDDRALGQICEAVFAAQRGKLGTDDAFGRVRAIYDQMLVDTSTSPVALAIASIASSRRLTSASGEAGLPEGVMAAMSRSDQVDMGIVGGAIGGAVIGGVIGGAGGAIIGGVIGGIAGGIATACAT